MALKTKKQTQPIYLSEEYRNSLGRMIDLTSGQMQRMKKKLREEIKEWQGDTSELHQKLKRHNDLIENVIEETDYPFEGASNVHIPLAMIYMKVYHSIERRSILSTDSIWYAETENEDLLDSLPNIEENLNYKARNKWNISESLSEVFWTTNRDGLGILQVPYVEEFEEGVQDVVFVEDEKQFLQEFPQSEYEDDLDKWNELLEQVRSSEVNEDSPLEIPITFDREVYKGPRGEVVDLADFVIFPATAKDIGIEYARGYGKRFTMRTGAIEKKVAEGTWDKDEADLILKKKGSDRGEFQKSQDVAEGLSSTGKSDHELFELVYRFKFKGEKHERKILLTYSLDADALPHRIEYPYRVDFYAIFRIQKKANRLIGGSIPGDADDLNEEIDMIHNQRNNSRKISEVPSFKAKKSNKDDLNPELERNQWKPGVIFWLDDPQTFEQFIVQPVDFGTSIKEEQNDMSIISLVMGVEPFLFSGAPAADNPDAPGNKTGLLISQSNMRMDDPITELREGVERVGEICLSHEYQFGPAQLKFMSGDSGKREPKFLPKRLLRRGLKIKMSAQTVVLNPDAEFRKWLGYAQALGSNPIIGKRMKSWWEMGMRALRAGRIPGREKILPTLEELQQEEVELRKAALQQLQAEQQENAEAQNEKQEEARNKRKQLTQDANQQKIDASDTKVKLIENAVRVRELASSNGKKKSV